MISFPVCLAEAKPGVFALQGGPKFFFPGEASLVPVLRYFAAIEHTIPKGRNIVANSVPDCFWKRYTGLILKEDAQGGRVHLDYAGTCSDLQPGV